MNRLVLHQTLRYDYPSPIGRLHHQLMVVPPPRHGDQERISASVEVRGAHVEVVESVDRFGNVAIEVRAPSVQRHVEFVVEVTVERRAGPGAVAAPGDFLEPTKLTEPDAALA
ncbi:MAG: hypothetical protein M3326_00925, partial [Actinomycetota bacterium]|nr:hypothetical protein [Actinomycetota bacterium]